MRFDDWDILLFPRDCKVPVKEFKVACHAIHDPEFSNPHGPFGLPTVCGFIPSLAAGTPFQISIHSWSAPSVSQFTRCYSKYGECANFEARVFVDGQLVASASLDRESDWPHVIIHSFGMSKNGDLEPLRFPSFRQELLRQNHWNPADDFGRIKIVISEGFPRDSLSMPIERVKNVVAFSFQHAPLEILEASGIAWPNPSMWRRIPVATSMTVPSYPSDDTESHAHSPRRKHSRTNAGLTKSSTENVHKIITNRSLRLGQRKTSMQSGSSRSTSGSTSTGTMETVNDSDAYFDWLNGMGLGMPDMYRLREQENFPDIRQIGRKSSNVNAQGHMVGKTSYSGQRFGLQELGDEEESDSLGYLRIPSEALDFNTSYSQDMQGTDGEERVKFAFDNDLDFERTGLFLPRIPQENSLSIDFQNTLAHSLLNQPMPAHMLANNLHTTSVPELRVPREDYIPQTAGPSPSTTSSVSASLRDQFEVGKTAQHPYTARKAMLRTESFDSRVRTSTRPDAKQHISSVLSTQESEPVEEFAMENAATHTGDKGAKRRRDSTLTPTSAAKSDDNHNRSSPRARLTALLAHSPTADCQ
ncbi:hypothetical protein TRIATDRAFT_270238 [Trichoderma atroviride IMI 206040]|uniref:Uncharacterized protein n=1 Tax=Hypocrea atroviridis (strain ATCC 20476 / IMI 206040) TaxID=452589 RepID=G9NGR4_HYPAI|nr:uncharacterized protein TRIATDRAFT_270238 [Trichoderma atroviride IMI 206040]EHK50475.1 hypothetical protein TRIATDRAFT_270238 [Trichoderma atroviride IMI 206040]